MSTPVAEAGPAEARVPAAQFAVLWLGVVAFFLSFFVLLPTLPMYAQALGIPESRIGVLVGAFPISAMLLRPVVGWAADRHGRRPFMLLGAAVFALSPGLYAVSASLAVLVLARLFHGAGMALFQTASQAMVADLAPPRRRGEVMGLFGIAGNVALAVGPMLGVWLVQGAGYGALFVCSAGAAVIALALAAAQRETLLEPTLTRLTPTTALSAAVAYPVLLELILMTSYGMQSTYLPLAAQAQGYNPGLFFLVMAAAVIAARAIGGRLSDRWGRPAIAAAGAALQAAALFALAAGAGPVAVAVAGALYGLGFGTAQPALGAWCVDLVGPAERGKAMGTFFTGLELGIALGAIGAGWVLRETGYAGLFLTGGSICLVGCALALLRLRGWSRSA